MTELDWSLMRMDIHKTLHRTRKLYSTCHDRVVEQFVLQMVIKKQTQSSKEKDYDDVDAVASCDASCDAPCDAFCFGI